MQRNAKDNAVTRVTQQHAWVVIVGGAFLAIIAFVLVFVLMHDESSPDRIDIAAKAAAAVVVVAAGMLAWASFDLRKVEHGFAEARMDFATDRDLMARFRGALALLDNEKSTEVRVGGVFAMERFILDAARLDGADRDVDWRMGLDVLADIISASPAGESDDGNFVVDRVGQAAATVIGRFHARTDLSVPQDLLRLAVSTGVLSGADLSGVDLSGATLSGAVLYGTNLSGAILYGVHLTRAKLSEANLSRAKLYRADLSEANLERASLFEAEMSGANLNRAYLSGADLSGATLSGANMYGTHLSRAYLAGANLFEANLSEAKLFGADLFRAHLAGADLSGADLPEADLYEANLSDADLSGANLFEVTLSGANLSGADLSGANLLQADLPGADLSGADLTDANLREVDLASVIYDDSTVWPDGFEPPPLAAGFSEP